MKAFDSPIDRRTLLRGVGVAMALPWLESLPVWGGEAASGSVPTVFPKRFAALFMGNGISPNHWWPKGAVAGLRRPRREPAEEARGEHPRPGQGTRRGAEPASQPRRSGEARRVSHKRARGGEAGRTYAHAQGPGGGAGPEPEPACAHDEAA